MDNRPFLLGTFTFSIRCVFFHHSTMAETFLSTARKIIFVPRCSSFSVVPFFFRFFSPRSFEFFRGSYEKVSSMAWINRWRIYTVISAFVWIFFFPVSFGDHVADDEENEQSPAFPLGAYFVVPFFFVAIDVPRFRFLCIKHQGSFEDVVCIMHWTIQKFWR